MVEPAKAGGLADAGTGAACTLDTRFAIASVSKQLVAVAVLLLAERGALTLDQPVSRWLPHTDAQWQHVTLHHLLTHTAGVGHWSDAPGHDVFTPRDHNERVTLLQQGTLLRAPGIEWDYSSPGYLLVGHIVECAANQPYDAFLTENVFAPLGMGATVAGRIPAGAARGHRDGKPLPVQDFTMMPGTGDVWSTVPDMARFTTSLHDGSLLSEASLAKLTRAHTTVRANAVATGDWLLADSYGYGLFLGSVGGARAIFHIGDIPGYKAVNAWVPDHAAAIAVLSNDETTDLGDLLEELHKAHRPW